MEDEPIKTKVLVCPECGLLMNNRNPVGHALSHYPEYLDPQRSSPEARKRQKMILSGGVTQEVYAKLHQEVE